MACGLLRWNRLWQSLVAVLTMSGCGVSFDSAQSLTIRMLGVLVAPDGAAGAFEPTAQAYTLEGVFLSPDPVSGEALSLYTGDPEEFTIIDRAQVLFKRDIDATWVGESFEHLVVRFAPSVTGQSKYASDVSLTLTDPDVSSAGTFVVEQGQGLEVTVNVQWKNTVTRDESTSPSTETMELPTFDLDIALD